MYTLSFFIAISSITFVSNGMISPFNLNNVPIEIINKIIWIDSVNTPSSEDFKREDFKAYVVLQSIINLRKSIINLHKSKDDYRFYFNTDFKKSCNKIQSLRYFCLPLCIPLSSVNKKLNSLLYAYRRLILTYLSDENILFSGYEFNKICHIIIQQPAYRNITYPNPYIELINFQRPVNITKNSWRYFNGYKISKAIDKVSNCKLSICGSIRGDRYMHPNYNTEYPILRCEIVIFAPFTTYNIDNFYTFFPTNDQHDSLAQSMQPIFDDWNTTHTDLTEFNHLKNLFDVVLERAFSYEPQSKKKILAFVKLCEYAYTHFNDFQYNTPTKRIHVNGARGGNHDVCAGIILNFNLGPMTQDSIPLWLINDILKIDAEQ